MKYFFIIILIYIILWFVYGISLYYLTGSFFQYNIIYGRNIYDSKDKEIFIAEVEYVSLSDSSNFSDLINKNIECWLEYPKFNLKYYYLGIDKVSHDNNFLRLSILNKNDSSLFFISTFIEKERGLQSVNNLIPVHYSISKENLSTTKFYMYKDNFIDSGYFKIR